MLHVSKQQTRFSPSQPASSDIANCPWQGEWTGLGRQSGGQQSKCGWMGFLKEQCSDSNLFEKDKNQPSGDIKDEHSQDHKFILLTLDA